MTKVTDPALLAILNGQGGAQPIVTPIPSSPKDQAREDRDNAAANRDEIRTGIAVRGERRDIGYKEQDYTLKLRSDFDAMPAVKDYRSALPVFVQALKTEDSPQGSNALIYAYAKIMDPGSVVRESEADSVSNSDTIFGRAYAYAQKQLDGTGTFSPEARAGLLTEIRTKMAELARAYDGQRNRFSADAEAFGLDPARVVGQHDAKPFLPEIERINEKNLSQVLTPEQQRLYDAVMKANPTATPEQLQEIFTAAGLPEQANLDQVVAARDEGRGVAPASDAEWGQSPAGQAVSGINEGIAGTFGLPIDIPNAINAGMVRGANWLFGTDLKTANEIAQETTGEDSLGSGGWWQNRFQDWGFSGPPPETGTGAFARRAGQTVGASLLPVGGTVNSGRQLATALTSAIGGGIGGATAEQVFPNNPAASFAGEVLGGGLTAGGLFANAQRRGQRAVEAAVPTTQDLREQAGQIYRRAEQRGVTADPTQTQQFADDFRQTLRDEGQLGPSGRITNADTSTNKALNLVEQYQGQPMRPTEMDTVRGVIAEGRKSPDAADQRLSGILLDQFDNWVRPMAPDFDEARGVASRYLQAEDLEQARDLAAARAGQFTGSGFENALRTEYRGLDRNIVKGREHFIPEVESAIRDVSRGTPASNAARALGRFAPTGPVSGGVTFGLPFVAGNAVGGPALGATLGAGAMGLGYAGRAAATRMGINNATRAELIARNGGNLAEVPLMTPETERIVAALALSQLAQDEGTPESEQGQPPYTQPNALAGRVGRATASPRGLFGSPR